MTATHPRRPRQPGLRRLVPLATLALLVAIGFVAPARAWADPYQTVNADQVQKMLGAPDVRVFDANSADVYARNHLPGAVHIGSRSLESLLPPDRTMRLVFYCTNPG